MHDRRIKGEARPPDGGPSPAAHEAPAGEGVIQGDPRTGEEVDRTSCFSRNL
jgi:hypothetical protein